MSIEELNKKSKMNNYLDEQLFTWSRWRKGSPFEMLGLRIRKKTLVENKELLLKHFVGYCDAEHLVCRPKNNYKATMFFKEDEGHFWTHITDEEFKEIFTS